MNEQACWSMKVRRQRVFRRSCCGELLPHAARRWLIPAAACVLLFCAGCARKADSIVESTGTIEATQIDVRCEVGGMLRALNYDQGDRVERGAVMAHIDHQKLDWQLKRAQAAVAEMDARLALLQHGYRREEVEKAQKVLQEADVQRENALREYRRIQKLYKEGVASDHERDKAYTACESARKRCEQAREQYMMVSSGFREEEIAAARAAQQSAQAQAQLIRTQIEDATVTAPGSGIVDERYVEHGEVVSAGSLLFSIVDLQDCWIMAYVSEKSLGRVHTGQKASVSVDSFPDKTFPGRVVYISSEAEFTPKNVQTKEERVKLVFGVKVEIDNARELLKPGMPADVIIQAEGPSAEQSFTYKRQQYGD